MGKRVLRLSGPGSEGKVMAACAVGKRVQKVQKVQRVVDCPAGNAYKVSVTGLAFVSLGKR